LLFFFLKIKIKKNHSEEIIFFLRNIFCWLTEKLEKALFCQNRQKSRFWKNSKNDDFWENQDPQKVLQLDIQLAVKPADLYIV
jgi:hypothetical protein